MNNLKHKDNLFIFCCIFLSVLSINLFAQGDSLKINQSFPVVFNYDTLFTIDKQIGPVTADQRAEAIIEKLNRIAHQSSLFKDDSFSVVETDISSDIKFNDEIIHSVFNFDIKDTSQTKTTLATKRMLVMQNSIELYSANNGSRILAIKVLIALGVVLFLFLIIWLIGKLFEFINNKMGSREQSRIRHIHIGSYQLLSTEQILKYALLIVKGIRILITILVIYLALPVLFRIFPLTESIATYMWALVWNPTKHIIQGFINYIPNLFALIVITFLFYNFTKVLNYFAREIETGKLVIKEFYSEWAAPTLSLIKFIVLVFYFIVSYNFLPGADSKVFQGVTVFLGLLVSIGSSSAISNIVAGLVITYMRPFKIGSFVKIGEVVGNVTEKNLLVTRVLTIKEEEITIPNATVLSSHIINYGNEKSGKLLIIHTTVTIGYDASWKQVHELLINAAIATKNIVANPTPFVFQTSLDDFYISYQINAYTEMPNIQAVTLSELHQNIQDKFNEAGVEIMSPHYRNIRDGNQTSIPENYLDDDYKAPRFNVAVETTEKKETNKQTKLNL